MANGNGNKGEMNPRAPFGADEIEANMFTSNSQIIKFWGERGGKYSFA